MRLHPPHITFKSFVCLHCMWEASGLILRLQSSYPTEFSVVSLSLYSYDNSFKNVKNNLTTYVSDLITPIRAHQYIQILGAQYLRS